MKKFVSSGTIVVVLVILAILIWGIGRYNNMVKGGEAVDSAWGNVENAYQRRADLIPNLVATVKGYAEHEESTLQEVVEARAKATETHIDASELTAENIQKFQESQGALSTALGKLLMIRESYPELKANQNFLELQSQLEGTENRINIARTEFNEKAQAFNVSIKKFPANIIASIGGFKERSYFKSKEGSDVAPAVQF
ncbi:MAG: LemA family protein [Candidatus Egerieousia sp.]